MKIYNRPITQKDLDNIATYMDDATREELHANLAPCTPEEFLKAYLQREPEFIEILQDEFCFEE